MKFAPVVSFLFAQFGRGFCNSEFDYDTDNDVDENDDSPYGVQGSVSDVGAAKYLNRMFATHDGKQWQQYKDVAMGGKKNQKWEMVRENGDICVAQGQAFKGDRRTSYVVDQKKALKDIYGNKNWKKPVVCCSKNKTTSAMKSKVVCDCIRAGQAISGNLGLSCCSNYAVEKDGKKVCGGIPPLGLNQPVVRQNKAVLLLNVDDCMYPGSEPLPEPSTTKRQNLHEDDYSDYHWDLKICGRRPCQHAGSKPAGDKSICCGGPGNKSDDRDSDPADTVCKCTPWKTTHSNFLATSEADCCSKQYISGTKTCDCIKENQELPKGIPKGSCCSEESIERNGTVWCRSENCTVQGEMMHKSSDWCCVSNTTGKQSDASKPCGCVGGGVAPHSGLASRCCSMTLQHDDTCAWIPTTGEVKTWFTKDECFSGLANSDNLCKCMPPLTKLREDYLSRNADQCCSKKLINNSKSPHDGLCSCIATGDPLGFGSDESHCCSGKAFDGRCVCARPGDAFKSNAGMERGDCCSQRAGEHFCQCSPKGSRLTKACCHGARPDDQRCGCIPDGRSLPVHEAENASAVCCNSGAACATTCGK